MSESERNLFDEAFGNDEAIAGQESQEQGQQQGSETQQRQTDPERDIFDPQQGQQESQQQAGQTDEQGGDTAAAKDQQQVPLPTFLQLRDELKETQRELKQLKQAPPQASGQAGQGQQQQQPAGIDLSDLENLDHADRERLESRVQEYVQGQVMNTVVSMSEQQARRTHGDERVNEALNAVRAEPATARAMLSQPDPYGALLQWHEQHQVSKEIANAGGIEAYKRKVIEEAQQGNGQSNPAAQPAGNAGGQAQQAGQGYPPSLSNASGGGHQAQPVPSDEDIFKDVFGKS